MTIQILQTATNVLLILSCVFVLLVLWRTWPRRK